MTFSNDNMTVSWSKIGSGPTCKDVSHVQLWWTQNTPTQTPTGGTPEITPTDEPTVVITPTDEPTVVITPTDEPTVVITPTDEPTVVITPTETTTGPTATPTFVPTQTSTPTPKYPDTFNGCRVPLGTLTDAGEHVGANVEVYTLDGRFVFNTLVKHEPGMAETPVFIDFPYANVTGGEFEVRFNGVSLIVRACAVVEQPESVEKQDCPETGCVEPFCEWVDDVEVVVIRVAHPVTGQTLYNVFSTKEFTGYQDTSGEYYIEYSVTLNRLNEILTEINSDMVVTTLAQCAMCSTAPMVKNIDGTFYGMYAVGSTEEHLSAAFVAQGVDTVTAARWAKEVATQFNRTYEPGFFPVLSPQGE